MASKKQAGSSTNGRNSAGRRLGIKVNHGSFVKAGGIIIRQRGLKFRAGENVGAGRDHTIFAKLPGIVEFSQHRSNRKRHFVNVLLQHA
jgi:large subunit ribosomal protein L27